MRGTLMDITAMRVPLMDYFSLSRWSSIAAA